MKSVFKKILTLTLVFMLIITCLFGCSSTGKKLMELGDEEISVNMLMFMMSRMKGNMVASVGTKAESDSYWDTVMNAATGQTYDAYYTEQVLESAKTYIAALHLFDELGLKLSDETVDEIDSELERLLETEGKGSKSYFNDYLSQYGANYKILREAYILEAKIAMLNDHLYGVNGAKIDASLYEEYYQENYVRFKQIFFSTTKVRYEKDENGDEIYYSNLTDKKVAYNLKREGAKPKEENGKVVKDEHGQTVYVYEKDGEQHISYDTKGTDDAPVYRNPVLNANGETVYDELTSEEMIQLTDKISLIMEKAKNGEYELFDKLVEEYGADAELLEEYPNGYYVTKNDSYNYPEIAAVVDELFAMNVGEIKRVSNEGVGIHIVMRYELDKGGYENSENSEFFRNADGTYNFISMLKSNLLSERLQEYRANIVIDEELRKTLSMKNVAPNYHY